MKRRTFLTSTAAASGLLTSTAGCLSSADGGASNLMLGSLADRPAVDSEFFERRSSVQRVFLETETGVKYGITDDTSDWVRLPVGGAVEAPQTSELAAGELAVGFDDESGAFELRAKDASGAEYRATVSGKRLSSIIPPDHRYTFENSGDTTTLTDTVGNVDGSINGMSYGSSSAGRPTSVTGTGYGDFDGINDRVNMGDESSLEPSGNTWSMCAWVYVDAVTDNGNQIIRKADNGNYTYNIRINPDLTVRLEYHPGNDAVTNFSSSSTVTTGSWSHIAGVLDGSGTHAIYIDGSQAASRSDTFAEFTTGSAVFSLGANISSGSEDHDGRIDDARVYDRALSASEISDIAAGNG